MNPPLNPVGAAMHAILVQGGFSTPAIEAYRILEDAIRILKTSGKLDAEWREGVRDTLAWVHEHREDNDVAAERARFVIAKPMGFMTVLEHASREPENDDA